MTNLKWIQSMSRGDMVEFLGHTIFGENVCELICGNLDDCTDKICNCEIAEWLKEERGMRND